jgi:hypothetical protein
MTDTYEGKTEAVAAIVGGRVVSTGGGYVAAMFPLDGANGFVALDIDADDEDRWVTWREDADGERCCDWNAEDLGIIPTDAYGLIREATLRALVAHTCKHWRA